MNLKIRRVLYFFGMISVDTVATVKLTRTETGRILIGDTRVSLDSVAYHFMDGATAESIAQNFPPLRLADVYGTIAYILENRQQVEDYVREQERLSDLAEAKLRKEYGRDMAEFRERILAREAERRELINS